MMTKSLGILPATFVVKARLMERTPLNTFDSERQGSPFLKCVRAATIFMFQTGRIEVPQAGHT